MKNYKFANKKPIELTPEELLELTESIAKIEYNRREDIQRVQSYEDGCGELLTYWYEKSAKGKIGMKEIQEKCDMKHFINLIHFEMRNGINYIVRKSKIQRMIYNTYSLNEMFGDNTLEYVIEDKKALSDLVDVENQIDLEYILSKIDDTIQPDKVIQYESGDIFSFSYRRLAKVYFDIFKGTRVSCKDLQNIIKYSNSNTSLEDDKIKEIMHNFKNYIKMNEILGGAN